MSVKPRGNYGPGADPRFQKRLGAGGGEGALGGRLHVNVEH